MKQLLVFISLIAISISCSIRGITNDYDKLTETQKTKIVQLINFDDAKPGLVHKINGSQLRSELKKHTKSIVYIFKNGCTSDYCKPLMVYESYAKANGYSLFLVMDGYINLDASLDQHISGTLFAIDNYHYKNNKRVTYTKYFINELLGKPLDSKQEEYKGNLFLFTVDKLEGIVRELPEK